MIRSKRLGSSVPAGCQVYGKYGAGEFNMGTQIVEKMGGSYYTVELIHCLMQQRWYANIWPILEPCDGLRINVNTGKSTGKSTKKNRDGEGRGYPLLVKAPSVTVSPILTMFGSDGSLLGNAVSVPMP